MNLKSVFGLDKQRISETVLGDVEKQPIDCGAEVEKMADEVPPRDQLVSVSSELKELQSCLHAFLVGHLDKVDGLRNVAQNGRKPLEATVLMTGDLEKQDDTVSHVETHMNNIAHFLKEYSDNVQFLQQKLDEKFPGGQGQKADDPDIDMKTYESMMEQFNMQLLVSTFTAGLILSFCAFVKVVQIGGERAQHLYNVGVLLSLFSITFHFFNILLSGRCVALCSNHTLVKEHTMAYFHRALATCEQLYLHGTLVFGVSVLEMSFVMFDSVVYPAVFCAMAALGLVVLATGKFRKMSVMYQNVVRIKALTWTVGGRVGGKLRK